MKKILLLFFWGLDFLCVYPQVYCETCYGAYIDGIWGASSSTYSDYYAGTFGEFVHTSIDVHPSMYYFKLKIIDYENPNKDQIKYHYKNNKYWRYKGILTYYVSDEYPDVKSQIEKGKTLIVAPWKHDVNKGQTPCSQRSCSVEVLIYPYKKYPESYKIFLNKNLGFGIHFYTNALKY